MKLLIPVVLRSPRADRAARGRWADAMLALLALGGIGIAAGSLAGLLLSETVGLFGFKELGYREAIVISIVLDVATIVLLGIFVYQAAADEAITSGTSPSTSGPGTGLDRCRRGTRQGRAGRSARVRC